MRTAGFPIRAFTARFVLLMAVGIALTPAGCQGNSASSFNADRAYSDLRKQVSFGPRVPGAPAHYACKEFLSAELKKSADCVREQSFTAVVGGKTLKLTNLIADFNPKAAKRILLLAHWDSRPMADQELDPPRRSQPILGANDGASGVAALLELARMFKGNPPKIGVTILLVDGEDYGRTDATMFLGSRYYAKNLRDRFDGAILLDMIGDKDLQVYREGNSENNAKPLNDRVWKAAAALGYGARFPDKVKYTISDDHIPLQQAGIPAIDVIDFDYAYWHTTEDTPDKCSPASLKTVGDTIARVVYEY